MSRISRTSLLAGVAIIAGLAAHGGAFAQDTDEQADEVITVTGSRIQRSGFTTPTPVTVVSTEALEMAAPGNIVTALVQLPQFFNSTTTSDPGGFFTSPGAGNLNLRGLEPARTLTLLNGRRVVSSTRYGGTDINTFPEEMMKSVEAVTGGASAAYGTDAVSGVVNFILDTEFIGARAHAQYGITDRGDNENWEAGFAFGADIGERGHLLFSAEQYDQDGVFTYEDRDWYQQWGIVQLPGQTIRRVRPGVTSTVATLNGVISAPGTPLDRLEFLPDGVTTRPFVMGPEGNAGATAAYQSHTSGTGTSGTDNSVHPTVQPDTGRESYFAYVDYDLTDDLTVFGQGIWGYNETTVSDLGGFYGAPFAPLIIFSGNPFLPANIQNVMTTNNIASITVQKVGSELDTSNRYDITENTMYSLTGGFEWDFLEGGIAGGDWLNGWTASSYYQAGQTDYNAIVHGGLRIDRLSNALDAVDDGSGNIVCRVNTQPFLARNGGRWSDCEPLNLFGQGAASPEALDYIIGYDEGEEIDTVLDFTNTGTSLGLRDHYISGPDKISSGQIQQDVFDLSFNGEVWKGWGAGPISAAFGYGYREESIFQVVRDPANPTNAETGRPVPPNDNLTDGNVNNDLGVRGGSNPNINNSVAIQFSKVPNIMGKLSTIEYFGETLVPLVANQPWMDQLNLSLAARRADYSGSGEIWAWKYGFDAQITDDFRLRATQSRDIRAATLSERFDRTGGFANVQCINPANPTGPRMTCSIFTVSGGNPEVQPETADTTTVGVVYQPSWLDGLSVSVDWYNIELQDAIASLTAQQVYDECQNGDKALCARIQNNSNGTPNLINMSVLNVNKAKVSGVDLEAAYRRSIELLGGGESIAARLYVGYLSENSRSNFGAATRHLEEGALYPELKVNMSLGYDRGPLSLYVQERYQSETFINRTFLNDWVEGIDIDDNDIDETWITDFNTSYTFENMYGGEWELFGNVANVFDADPPVVANFANFGQTATQTGGNFDRLGRRYTVGVRLRY
jgi:outer membrane receptor protein involved in Fe transport